jgi:hypothetical protein
VVKSSKYIAAALLACTHLPPPQVHTAHSNVPALSPLLRSTLSCQLVPFSSAAAPLQLQAACFPGCVQLLANVIALPAAAAASGAEDVAAIQISGFVASLLGSSTEKLIAVCRAGAGLAGQLAREGMPAIDVRVGTVTASSAAATAAAANAPNAPNYPHVSLLWCDLACLPAGRQQQLTLHLQLPATGGAAAAATACRLLCFNSGGVLLDEDAELQQTLR